MKLVAIMPVRNEAWILGLSARVALQWVDELIILNHASTDTTHNVLHEIWKEDNRHRLFGITEGNADWDEMAHRQKLLDFARGRGATHVALIDADEILTGNLLPTIRSYIENISPGYILRVPGYNLRGSIHRFHGNGIWGNRTFSLAFKDDALANWHGDTFHHREPFGVQNLPYQPLAHGQGGVMHLWGADERRLIAKHALYKMTERLRWPIKPVAAIDRAYNLAVRESASNGTPWACQWNYAAVPAAWWEPYAGLMQHLELEAEPWQEAEARSLLDRHGAELFAGLDLFGLAESAAVATSD